MDEILAKAQQALQEKIDNLTPENLREGVTAFGVTGTCEGNDLYRLTEPDGDYIALNDSSIPPVVKEKLTAYMTEHKDKLQDIIYALRDIAWLESLEDTTTFFNDIPPEILKLAFGLLYCGIIYNEEEQHVEYDAIKWYSAPSNREMFNMSVQFPDELNPNHMILVNHSKFIGMDIQVDEVPDTDPTKYTVTINRIAQLVDSTVPTEHAALPTDITLNKVAWVNGKEVVGTSVPEALTLSLTDLVWNNDIGAWESNDTETAELLQQIFNQEINPKAIAINIKPNSESHIFDYPGVFYTEYPENADPIHKFAIFEHLPELKTADIILTSSQQEPESNAPILLRNIQFQIILER